MELNVQEENRLMQLLQLDQASFEKLLSFAERRHNPDNLLNHADLQHRIGEEIKKQALGQRIRWQYTMSGLVVQKVLAGEMAMPTVPVLHVYLGIRSPIIGKSELDNHNWFVLTLECNPADSDIARGIKAGLDELRRLNAAQMNGGAIDTGPQALE